MASSAIPVRTLPLQLAALAGWIGLCFAVAAVGAVASVQAGSFYAQLVRPSWAPPGWLFGPVWSALYLAMAVAAWLVWRAVPAREARGALLLFLAQLAANALWSWVFFAWHRGGWAMADIAVLWLLIAATLAAFARIRPLAALLLAPYLAWVSFAAALNYWLWRANPGLLG